MPWHIKDLRRRYRPTAFEEDKDSDTVPESESGNMSVVGMGPVMAQDVMAESHDDDVAETEGDGVQIDEDPPPLRRSTRQKRAPSPCHFCDQEIKGECSERRDLPRAKRTRTCFACKSTGTEW